MFQLYDVILIMTVSEIPCERNDIFSVHQRKSSQYVLLFVVPALKTIIGCTGNEN